MARIYYDKDADLKELQGRRIAVIGYGSQGHAHALNLRESGCDVVVGLPAESRSRAKAQAEGLTVLTPSEAAELAKLSGAAFDVAYVANEVAYHKAVNDALQKTLIPSAKNAELKTLLTTGLKIFQGHQAHAEHLAATVK